MSKKKKEWVCPSYGLYQNCPEIRQLQAALQSISDGSCCKCTPEDVMETNYSCPCAAKLAGKVLKGE